MFCQCCPAKRKITRKQKHLLTDSVQHDTVPALLGQCKLPVEFKLDSVVSPHLVNDTESLLTTNLKAHHANCVLRKQQKMV